ncbi:MAG TPA: Asd/ArgC dimerization domain-containing protein [Candidatus Acidoferrales bacterium]|nr:Asd/ArgC dimerization domain-containing protein [Candidatus Acidoferrales bacterium]
MPTPDRPLRIAIVGAGSPRGKDLIEVLGEGAFAGAELRLFDEDIAVGALTRAGDEPAVIAAVDEGSFEGAQLVFFAGGAPMAARHAAQARRAGATVVDLSEDPGLAGAVAWLPALDRLVGRPAGLDGGVARSPSAAAIVAAMMAAALDRFSPVRLALVFFRPVSERGQEGIDELERQTVSLLSFQPVPEEVFGVQVAFNLLDDYGPGNQPSLEVVRQTVVRDVAAALNGRVPSPAIQVLQAPVFFSYAFTAYAEPAARRDTEEIERALAAGGLAIEPATDPRPTNRSVAGRAQPVLGGVARDPAIAAGCWLWGAADNVRLVATNAVAIAEILL